MFFPLQKTLCFLNPPGRPLAWHSDGSVSRHFLRPHTADFYSRMSVFSEEKMGGFSGTLPFLPCSKGVADYLLGKPAYWQEWEDSRESSHFFFREDAHP